MKNNPFNKPLLTFALQRYYMGICWPEFAVSQSGQWISWTGELTPAAMCDTYTVRIRYKLGSSRPDVHILTPQLRARPGERIPHIFSDTNTLCLHLREQWHSGKIIAYTIVPWTSWWLFFYETWLLTGHWEGGGHQPPASPQNE